LGLQTLQQLAFTNRDAHPFYRQFLKVHNRCIAAPAQNAIGYPVFYINLDRSPQRRQIVEDQLAFIGHSEWYRVQAVDGRLHTQSQSQSQSRLSSSERACISSHLRAIRAAYESGCEIAVVMEDDAYFLTTAVWPYTFPELVANEAPKGWTLLNMYPSTAVCGERFKSSKFVPHTETANCYLAACYLINRQGMENVLHGASSSAPGDASGYDGADAYIFRLSGHAYHVRPETVCVFNDAAVTASAIQDTSDLEIQLSNAKAVLDVHAARLKEKY
jgi:hypothetical protein